MNVFSPRSGLSVLVLLSTVLGAAFPLVEVREFQKFRIQLVDLEARGRGVVLFSAANPDEEAAIERSSCDALTEDTSVARAGLLLAERNASFPQLGTSIPVFRASTTLFPLLSSVDALIGSELPGARELRRVAAGSGRQFTSAPADVQPEGIRANSSLVFALDSATVTGPLCIAVLNPLEQDRREGPRLAAALHASGGSLAARSVLQESVDIVASFEGRPTRFLGLASGFLGAISTTVMLWARSSELATYRVSGTSRRSLFVLLATQHALLAGCFVTSAAIAIAFAEHDLVSVAETVLLSLCGAALWVIAGAVGAVRPVASRVLTLAKDR
jgi:hypothetical protein